MVKIAVAGGTGNVATNLLKATIASKKHEVTIFTRSLPTNRTPGVSYVQTDYQDLAALTKLLQGFTVCLSFIVVYFDTDNTSQKNLIHACISAGVKRFAPSEWAIKNNSGLFAYANKDLIAAYLSELKANNDLGRLEYCLFQPSIFTDYFAHPHPQATELVTWPFFIDMQNRRAMLLDEGDQAIVVTTVHDDAAILLAAIEDPRPWPNGVGGIRGCRTTIASLIALGKEIRGGEWSVETVRSEDILKGELKTSWVPVMAHPAIPVEQQAKYSAGFVVDFLKCAFNGTWDVGDEWNARFPEYRFTSAEEYLREVWGGKE